MDKIFFVTSNKNHFKEEVDLTEVNNYLSKNKDYYVASVTPLYQSIAIPSGNNNLPAFMNTFNKGADK